MSSFVLKMIAVLCMPMQSAMILALPLMLRYNNEKGYGWKYFFYIFYPLHTVVLFYLANRLSG